MLTIGQFFSSVAEHSQQMYDTVIRLLRWFLKKSLHLPIWHPGSIFTLFAVVVLRISVHHLCRTVGIWNLRCSCSDGEYIGFRCITHSTRASMCVLLCVYRPIEGEPRKYAPTDLSINRIKTCQQSYLLVKVECRTNHWGKCEQAPAGIKYSID